MKFLKLGLLWIAVVVGCGVVGFILPLMLSSSPSAAPGPGIAAIFFGFIGLFAGTLPATWLVLTRIEKGRRPPVDGRE